MTLRILGRDESKALSILKQDKAAHAAFLKESGRVVRKYQELFAKNTA